MEFIEANWLLILLVAIAAIVILWYIFHAARRTRVTGDRRDVLDEGAERAARNQALIDAEPAASASTVKTASKPAAAPMQPPATPAGLTGIGEAVEAGAAAEARAARASDPTGADDLTQLKGVGPKLAALLNDLGVTSLAQIADWTESDIERIDGQLGRFQGRIRRDAWVEQAKLLTSGDTAGYAAKFGNRP